MFMRLDLRTRFFVLEGRAVRAPSAMSHPAVPPPMPNHAAWKLEFTTFYIAVCDPVEVWGRMLAYFENDGHYAVASVRDAKVSAKVRTQTDARRSGFVAKVRLYSVHEELSVFAVEWQKRSGCSLSSHEAFHRFKARFAMPVL